MNTTLILAIITITLALIFYTIGVFSERRSGELNWKHVGLFALGLIFDTTGTTIMSGLVTAGNAANPLHQITGMLAILLMAFHLIWAIIVLLRKNEKAKATFHKFSLVVWLFWLIPYVIGMLIGMGI
ncbi:TIGR03987 family protein [Enterococcus sp. ALS3]|uniref:TIGR03987 family protein n=1 Tax=Enterococcus alishanensis TaxID=1303817 RepID=A0ABS6TCK5_9ENTE|nr:HsmA family protein [Enterococcus alishanensis]MBV7390579.1 TIGR03987 family protein [Enterococcus alishanensis]